MEQTTENLLIQGYICRTCRTSFPLEEHDEAVKHVSIPLTGLDAKVGDIFGHGSKFQLIVVGKGPIITTEHLRVYDIMRFMSFDMDNVLYKNKFEDRAFIDPKFVEEINEQTFREIAYKLKSSNVIYDMLKKKFHDIDKFTRGRI